MKNLIISSIYYTKLNAVIIIMNYKYVIPTTTEYINFYNIIIVSLLPKKIVVPTSYMVILYLTQNYVSLLDNRLNTWTLSMYKTIVIIIRSGAKHHCYNNYCTISEISVLYLELGSL